MQRGKQQADTGALSPARKVLWSPVARLQRTILHGLRLCLLGFGAVSGWKESRETLEQSQPQEGSLGVSSWSFTGLKHPWTLKQRQSARGLGKWHADGVWAEQRFYLLQGSWAQCQVQNAWEACMTSAETPEGPHLRYEEQVSGQRAVFISFKGNN